MANRRRSHTLYDNSLPGFDQMKKRSARSRPSQKRASLGRNGDSQWIRHCCPAPDFGIGASRREDRLHSVYAGPFGEVYNAVKRLHFPLVQQYPTAMHMGKRDTEMRPLAPFLANSGIHDGKFTTSLTFNREGEIEGFPIGPLIAAFHCWSQDLWILGDPKHNVQPYRLSNAIMRLAAANFDLQIPCRFSPWKTTLVFATGHPPAFPGSKILSSIFNGAVLDRYKAFFANLLGRVVQAFYEVWDAGDIIHGGQNPCAHESRLLFRVLK